MDRQPLTDRLGDRLLAEYGGAAAAYSLRALNGNGDSVVRVRRASDNDEKDFTAEQIELGEMVNWVTEGSATADGFVETWYDQSGNGNDATQSVAAAQPKIVDGGSLVAGGIDFDGVNDALETNNSDLCNITELSLFAVLTPFTGASQEVAVSAGSIIFNSTAYGGWKLNLNGYADAVEFQTQFQGSGTITVAPQSVTASESLVTSILNVPNGTTSVNGVEGITTTDMLEPFNTDAGRRKLRIGCQFTFTRSTYYSKPIKEIILYPSDQSANRPAIEANINNHYNIYP